MDPTTHRDQRLAEYERQIAHYTAEYVKLMKWRDRRMDQIRADAAHAARTRPIATHDAETILWAWANGDPKLKEYNAGLEIVERRLTLYGTLAINRRLALQDRIAIRPHTA